MVVTKRSQIGPASTQTSYQAVPQKHGKIEMSSPAAGNAVYAKMPEGQLFAEIVDRYEARDQWGFEARAKAFMSKFTNSDRRDEVVYFKGLMELGEKNYGLALTQFNRILRDHPNGKKAPSAMFAKGVTYKRMNLLHESKQALADVTRFFPGSPEAMRAKVELKILR
jgi:TolA-binding protein